MAISTHQVEVIRIEKIEKHPNADRLGIVRVFGGYPCVVALDQFKEGDLAAYIPPDSIVPNVEDFDFLQGHFRIRVKRLRGVLSMGLLMRLENNEYNTFEVGADVAELWGITHYEPPIHLSGGQATTPPKGYHPVYDVETLRGYPDLFMEGELVQVTEKIHGANGRWCYVDGEMYCGSHTQWKVRDSGVIWWQSLVAHKEIEEFVSSYPGLTVYGEVYGSVQSLHYGVPTGQIRVAVFDLLAPDGIFIGAHAARELAPELPWTPIVDTIPYSFAAVESLADGKSLIPGADHYREGIVIRPYPTERTDLRVGRVCAKIVSNTYLEKS